MTETDKPKMMGGILLVGYHHWGWGEDLDAAKRKLREVGGRLTDGYIIYTFNPDAEFLYVDQFGAVTYKEPPGWADELPDGPIPAPWTETYVHGAKTKKAKR